MMHTARIWLFVPLLLAACATTSAPGQLGDFTATLARQDSATLALEEWCAARGFADPAQVSAASAGGPDLADAPAARSALQAAPGDIIGYRHVQLSCGGRVLSDAHNWFVRTRLTDAMNHALDTTSTPFGKVIAPLGFTRSRVASQRGPMEGCPSDTVLSHRAILYLPDGRPISTVVECYTPANFN